MRKVYRNDDIKNLIYITIEVLSISGDIVQYFCLIENYKQNIYKISRIDIKQLKKIENAIFKSFRINDKNKQDMYLDDYGEIFFNEILKIENSKCLVISNGFFFVSTFTHG